ncbi:MAG: hypothetical protein NT160_04035 [Actinobacteria bacterium]|nr:hypothetical protein [Actinomycetota bacterium]
MPQIYRLRRLAHLQLLSNEHCWARAITAKAIQRFPSPLGREFPSSSEDAFTHGG